MSRFLTPNKSLELAACVGLLGVVLGCGGASDYAPVSGVVTMNGEPVADATVVFASEEGKSRGLFSTGRTDSQGRYSLVTQGSDRIEGARVGLNGVTISALEVEDRLKVDGGSTSGSIVQINAPPPKVRSRLPVKYQSFDQSGLRFDVPPRGTDEADFALEN